SGGKIARITTGGVITEFPIPSCGGCDPRGIAFGADNAVWFTKFSTNKIGRFNPAGSSFTEFSVPTGGSGPLTIVNGPDGNLWFTEYFGNKIGKVTLAGAVSETRIPAYYS